MTIRPIRSEEDHTEALARAALLAVREDQEAVDELDVLQAVIERWERARFQFEAPTPPQAIRFRMDQLGMKARDLTPYLGSKSRVSEILNGQRQLTVDQIRALGRHLQIPAESLIGVARHQPPQRPSTLSGAAIQKLKAFGVIRPRETPEDFMTRAATAQPAIAMLRKTRTDRTNAKTDLGALEAWCAAVLLRAETRKLAKHVGITRGEEAARRLARLSREPDGPSRAERELAAMGIALVILDHLPGTFLDGAAMCRADGSAVIALTLRHDRLDNFWFTLLHEFAHVSRHLGQGVSVIVDDLDVKSSEAMEAEADEFARDALVPRDVWQDASTGEMTTERLEGLAALAGVHPAIVAGRWRWEHGDYRRFSKLVGRGEVRRHFV